MTVGTTRLLLDQEGKLSKHLKEMVRVGRPTIKKDIDFIRLSGISSHYNALFRML